MESPWNQILDEAAAAFRADAVAARAYSEYMPPPYVALKPYAPGSLSLPATGTAGFALSEYEEAEELEPGLARLAEHLAGDLASFLSGGLHELSKALLDGNPAWTPQLAQAAKSRPEPITLVLPVALSKTQDDKGRVPWSVFGCSHLGPARAFWASFGPADELAFCRLAGWLAGLEARSVDRLLSGGLRVLPRALEPTLPAFDEGPLPAFVRPLLWKEGARTTTLLTFESFARLPQSIRDAYCAGTLRLVPSPLSLVFFEHPGYRRLALPWAPQIPLLHHFPRSERSMGLRIPQSGWLDENRSGDAQSDGHRMARTVVRTHRWQRVERDAEARDDDFADQVTAALFSADPDLLGLYHKPMGRNAQVWSARYEPVLHGPSAKGPDLQRAAALVAAGGRFGYRFLFPPMRAGAHSLFLHRPMVGRLDPVTKRFERPPLDLLGLVTAERDGAASLELNPVRLDRPGHRDAARCFPKDPGLRRRTTSWNVRKILDCSEALGLLAPSLALRLLDVPKDSRLDAFLASLPKAASEPAAGERTCAALKECLGPAPTPQPGLTFEQTRTRAFEETLWKTIDGLASGRFRDKDNADAVKANEGRTGGALGASLGRSPARKRDLDALADHLAHEYERKIAAAGMTGRALVGNHRFRWDTDFDFGWSGGWTANRRGPAERNLVVVIPGRDNGEAVVMADHYDTAYMEDVYEPSRGGDRLRAAAAGADDNHSATAALLAAADVLLPLSRDGKLARSVWLVHLTGEEFPADCLGARALGRGLVEGTFGLTLADGTRVDLSQTRVRGAFVLDMIGHNHDRDRDVFQIAPGEGQASAELSAIAHEACERWNQGAREWNQAPERRGRGRSVRVADAPNPPPPPIAEHLRVQGEVRAEWEPRSALYNTDAQIFSDLGIPVVLFMENYDLRRSGYHDTHDTMKNIDLDYCAALTAIAIESVVEASTKG